MIEAVAILALLVFARRLRKSSKRLESFKSLPGQTIRIDVFVHHYPGPGEMQPIEQPLREERAGNVVAFRRTA